MAISSAGVGSGLNVQSIVSQLVALERQPVQLLQKKSAVIQTKVSAFGQIKSDLAALQDAASALMNASTWTSKTFTSDNTSAVSGSVASTALASTFSLAVNQLAKGQSAVSGTFPLDYKAPTIGTLNIQLGTWDATYQTFSNAGSTAVSIAVAKDDSLATIAASINAKSSTAGVSATVVTTNGTQQLLLRSTSTGAAAGFKVTPSAGLEVFSTQASSTFKQPFAAPANASLSLQLLDSNGDNLGSALPFAVSKGDSLDAIAAKINANPPAPGVVASKVTDPDGTQKLQLVDGNSASVSFTVSDTSIASPNTYAFTQVNGSITRTQPAQDASITIDGVNVASATNTVTDALPGVTLKLLATTPTTPTSTPALVTIAEDKDAMKAKIQAFQDAYNKLNTDLKAQTAYDAASKTGGPLLGDSTVNGLQSMVRSLVGALGPTSSTISRLSGLGLEIQADGSLKTNSTKLNAALENTANVKAFFASSTGTPSQNGIAKRIYDFVLAANSVGGAVSAHSAGFQKQIDQNNKSIDALNTHVDSYQKQLLAQYTALDKNMAKLNSLGSYVSQQITTWNKG